MNRGRALSALLALLFVAGILAVNRFELSSDITNLMPAGSESALLRVSRAIAISPVARTLVITLDAGEPGRTRLAAEELSAWLRAQPAVASLRSGADDDLPRATYELYFPRRYAFYADEPERIPALLAPEALAQRAARAKEALAQPAGLFLKRLLPEDPLGAFPRIVERLSGLGAGVALRDGQFFSADGRFAVLFVTTGPSAFAGAEQAAFLAALDAKVAALAAANPGPFVFESTGASRFAVWAEKSIRGDTTWLSTLSLAAVVAIFLAAFRSLRSLALAGLPVLSGILAGITTSLLVFGRIDGLTLGFGAAMIGVVIDYPVLLLAHMQRRGAATPREVLREVAPAIALGALTTVASFAGLGLTTTPGLQQLALFSATGVLAALAVTLLVLPAFSEDRRSGDRWVARMGFVFEGCLRLARVHRRPLAMATLAAAALAGAALPRLVWQDDLSKLWRVAPEVVEEDARVRARVASMESGRFVVVSAPDVDTALARNDAVALVLADAREEGVLDGFTSLHAMLWSETLQRENERQIRAVPDLGDRVRRAFEAQGFRPEAFAPFERSLADPAPDPLDLAALLASPLGELASSLVVPLDPGAAILTQVRGIRSEERLEAALRDVPEALLFDQGRFLSSLFGEFRAATLEQIAVGNLLVLALVLLRYRSLRPALAAFLPCLLVTLFVLGLFAVSGTALNLLHVVGLVLVTGMGVDYAIFVVDAARSGRGYDATMLGLVVCCATTACTFGILAFSVHPALQAVGVTVGLGVVLSLLCAPLALLFLGAVHEAPRDVDGRG